MAKREDVAALLEAAVDHARERAWADAAEQLVAAWRKAPSGRIAELLVAIERPLPPPAPLEGDTVAKREARWHTLAAGFDAAQLPRLLAEPWPVHPKTAKARIIALEAWAPSPHIAIALLDLLRRGRYRSNAGRVVARRAAQWLFALKDPALSQYLDALEKDPGLGAAGERRELVAVLKRRRPVEPTWTTREAAALDALAAIAASTATVLPVDRLPDLEAAVYATPDDDGPRHVLADYLIERADPRGELISLQLARHTSGRAPTPRERALLRDAGRTWVEALEADGAKVAAFERGFPSVAHMHGDVFATPAWATIDTLVWFQTHKKFSGSPLLRGLRSLEGITTEALPELTLERDLDRLWVRGLLFPRAQISGATAAAPRVLQLDYEADPGWRARVRQLLAQVFGWPLGRRLREAHIVVNATMLEFAAQVFDETTQLEAIAIDPRRGTYEPYWGGGYWSARLARDALELTWCEKYTSHVFASIADVLGSMKPRSLTRVTVTARSKAPVEAIAQLRARLDKVFDRWPAITERKIFD